MTATQVKHPWRATVRTVLAATVGVATLLPEVLAEAHVDGTALGVQAIAVAGAVTRVLAHPAVEGWLARFVPFLAAQPAEAGAAPPA